MENFVPVSEIISKVINSIHEINGEVWQSEPWGKSVWGVYSSEHWKLLDDGEGNQYPLAIYSMIRESDGIPTLWKTIEWRNTETREKPITEMAKKMMGDLQNELSEIMYNAPTLDLPTGFFQHQERSKYHHKDSISHQGMSRSAVMCKLDWMVDFVIPNDEHGWGMWGSMTDFVQEFAYFSTWGSEEIKKLLESIN